MDSSVDALGIAESHALLANGNGSEVEPVEGDTPVDSQGNNAEGETELAQGERDLAQGNMTGAEPSSDAVIGMQNTVEGQTALSADDTFQSQTSEDTLQGLQQTTEKEHAKSMCQCLLRGLADRIPCRAWHWHGFLCAHSQTRKRGRSS